MTTIVSPEQLKRQKIALIAFSIFLIAMGIFMLARAFSEDEYMILFVLPICIVLPFQFINDLKRICSLSYDDHAIYYSLPNSSKSKTVSLANIRSITIGGFDAFYRINLFTPDENGSHIYFKYQDFFIPYIDSGKHKQVYKLRDKIDTYKKMSDESFTWPTQIIEMAQ